MSHFFALAKFRADLRDYQAHARAARHDYSQTVTNTRELIFQSRQLIADADLALGLGLKLHCYFANFPDARRFDGSSSGMWGEKIG